MSDSDCERACRWGSVEREQLRDEHDARHEDHAQQHDDGEDRGGTHGSRTLVSLRFVTRAGCSLCQERLPVVQRLTRLLGVSMVVEDLGETHPPDFAERIPTGEKLRRLLIHDG